MRPPDPSVRRARSSPPPASPPPGPAGSLPHDIFFSVSGFGPPALQQLGLAEDIEPRQRFRKHTPVSQRPFYPGRQLRVAQAALHVEDLLQPIDVTASDRQRAERQPGGGSGLTRPTRTRSEKAGRHDQAAEQDGVGQTLGRFLEARAVGVECAQATATRHPIDVDATRG